MQRMGGTLLLALLLVIPVLGQAPGFDPAKELFGDFENPLAVTACFGMIKFVDFKGVQPKIMEYIKAQGIEESRWAEVYQKVYSWAIGNCIDSVEERPKDVQADLLEQVIKDKMSFDTASTYLDIDEAARLGTETSKVHHAQDKISKVFANMAKLSEKHKNDPDAMREKLEKLKDMNDKLGSDLQGRIKGLESSKGVQIFLALFALGMTVILGLGCYCCFFAGGKNKSSRDEILQQKLNEHQEKLDRLKALEREIHIEKQKLKGVSPDKIDPLPADPEPNVSESESEKESAEGKQTEVASKKER